MSEGRWIFPPALDEAAVQRIAAATGVWSNRVRARNSLFLEAQAESLPRPKRGVVHRIDRKVAIGRERTDFDQVGAFLAFDLRRNFARRSASRATGWSGC